MPVMLASLYFASLIGGIVEELLHLPHCFEPLGENLNFSFCQSGHQRSHHRLPPWAMPWRSDTLLGKVRLAFLGSFFVGQAGRGLGTGVDIGAAALELSAFECRRFLLRPKCCRLM
jgi:hypothetical protein